MGVLLAPNNHMEIPRSIFGHITDFLLHFPTNAPEWGSIHQATGKGDQAPAIEDLVNIVVGHYVPV